MRVLIACECSGRVRNAFRKLGHDAWSCDLQPDERPESIYAEFHLQGYIEDFIDLYPWDLMIAHPPCTDIAVCGCNSFHIKRANGSQKASIDFFMMIAKAKIPRIAIENPICIMSSEWRKPTQIIQPWMFGEGEKKATCLWLKNLPKLKATHIVNEEHRESNIHFNNGGTHSNEPRGKWGSRTFFGIARAMADQWGNNVKPAINKFYS